MKKVALVIAITVALIFTLPQIINPGTSNYQYIQTGGPPETYQFVDENSTIKPLFSVKSGGFYYLTFEVKTDNGSFIYSFNYTSSSISSRAIPSNASVQLNSDILSVSYIEGNRLHLENLRVGDLSPLGVFERELGEAKLLNISYNGGVTFLLEFREIDMVNYLIHSINATFLNRKLEIIGYYNKSWNATLPNRFRCVSGPFNVSGERGFFVSFSDFDNGNIADFIALSEKGLVIAEHTSSFEIGWEVSEFRFRGSDNVVLASNNGTSLWYSSPGVNRTFFLNSTFSSIGGIKTPKGRILAQDLDGDGEPEIPLLYANSTLSLFSLSNGTVIWSKNVTGRRISLVCADYDFDGLEDIIILSGEELTAISFGMGIPIWRFNASSLGYSLSERAIEMWSVQGVFPDFNNDGFPDIYLKRVNRSDDSLEINIAVASGIPDFDILRTFSNIIDRVEGVVERTDLFPSRVDLNGGGNDTFFSISISKGKTWSYEILSFSPEKSTPYMVCSINWNLTDDIDARVDAPMFLSDGIFLQFGLCICTDVSIHLYGNPSIPELPWEE